MRVPGVSRSTVRGRGARRPLRLDAGDPEVLHRTGDPAREAVPAATASIPAAMSNTKSFSIDDDHPIAGAFAVAGPTPPRVASALGGSTSARHPRPRAPLVPARPGSRP